MKRLKLDNRISFEKQTADRMIRIYCSANHGRESLCDECRELEEYSFARIDKCPLRPTKPVCANCTVHCYKPAMRERIKQVMRFAGPRIIYKAPFKSMIYLLLKAKLIAWTGSFTRKVFILSGLLLLRYMIIHEVCNRRIPAIYYTRPSLVQTFVRVIELWNAFVIEVNWFIYSRAFL